MATALLILDMQNYFFNAPEKRTSYPQLISAINELIQAFEKAETGRIYHIISLHKADRSTWSQNMLYHNAGCLLEGTTEAEIVADLLPSHKQVVIPKTRHSAFIRTGLEDRLRRDGVHHVVLSGVFLHGCVALSAIDAWSLDFKVTIAEQCVFSHRPDLAGFITERLRSMFNIPFLTNAQLLAEGVI